MGTGGRLSHVECPDPSPCAPPLVQVSPDSPISALWFSGYGSCVHFMRFVLKDFILSGVEKLLLKFGFQLLVGGLFIFYFAALLNAVSL